MEYQCALIKTLYDYCPSETKVWWPSTAEIGTKLLYLPSSQPVMYGVPLSHILGKVALLPAGMSASFPCAWQGEMMVPFQLVNVIVLGSLGQGANSTTLTHGP